MKVVAERSLFWFLRDKTELDLGNKSNLDIYVQQVITHGKTKDIKDLLKTVEYNIFKTSFERIKRFVPPLVKRFWEDYFENIDASSRKNS